jgi:hypothetical protein
MRGTVAQDIGVASGDNFAITTYDFADPSV